MEGKVLQKIRVLFHMITKDLNSNLKDESIRSTQSRILFHLYKDQKKKIATYQKDLEDKLGLSKSSLSEILTKMETNNLIERKDVPGSRLKIIAITETGKKKQLACEKKLQDLENLLLQEFEPDEIDHFIDMLDIMIDKVKLDYSQN